MNKKADFATWTKGRNGWRRMRGGHLIYWDGTTARDTWNPYSADQDGLPNCRVLQIWFAETDRAAIDEWLATVKVVGQTDRQEVGEMKSMMAAQRKGWQLVARQDDHHETVKALAAHLARKVPAATFADRFGDIKSAWDELVAADQFDYAWAVGLLPAIESAERYARNAHDYYPTRKIRKIRDNITNITRFREHLKTVIAAEGVTDNPYARPATIETDTGQQAWAFAA